MVSLHDFSWEVLDRSRHAIRDFSSGYEVFDEFLFVDSIMQQASGLSQTRVFTDGSTILAYYTSKCTKLTVSEDEVSEIGASEKMVPAIEIPMLAVDSRVQKRGIGTEMLEEILFQTGKISQLSGCRYLFLRAVKEDWLLCWYRKYGFKEIPFEVIDDYTQPMSYKLPTVRELSPDEFYDLF